MTYQGSCHCGDIAYTVDGEIGSVLECNCSHCQRKGVELSTLDVTPYDGRSK